MLSPMIPFPAEEWTPEVISNYARRCYAQGMEDAARLCREIQAKKEAMAGNEMAVAVATGAMLCAQAITEKGPGHAE